MIIPVRESGSNCAVPGYGHSTMFLICTVFLSLLKNANTDSHSLWVLATFISGETQFPKFSAVLMVDDVQVEYFDSNNPKVVSRRHWKVEDVVEEAELKSTVMSMIRDHLNAYFQRLKPSFNHTGGVHTYQRITGCELSDDGQSPLMLWDAYDGTGTRSYSKVAYTHNPLLPEVMWSKFKIEASKLINTNFYQPLCIRTLKNYLKQEKNTVKRKVRPRVRVMQKARRVPGGVQVSCLATGFYPRHINMTLLRDGHNIPEEELIMGELLPNGDGTYQQRRTLSISDEERQERHNYTCTVTHTSLGNKLDISWEPGPGPDTTFIAAAVIVTVTVTVALICTMAAFITWRRKRAGPQGYGQPSQNVPLQAGDATARGSHGPRPGSVSLWLRVPRNHTEPSTHMPEDYKFTGGTKGAEDRDRDCDWWGHRPP
ncbi:hypothetical protein AAFF_G00196440 [Aldrovandia affinis]|uniref:Ig-like domain-containing protein n=1 Tax=Aldrovandia affinis TaxID=143900 RepID=A0AAD7RIU8_9TELE|nr:hypothetical protein AAFF_G00196440 [Aldrovandia affinis]